MHVDDDGKFVVCKTNPKIDVRSVCTYMCVETTLADLKKLVKQAEKQKKYWAKRNKTVEKPVTDSFIHFSPQLSFFVDYFKRGSK